MQYKFTPKYQILELITKNVSTSSISHSYMNAMLYNFLHTNSLINCYLDPHNAESIISAPQGHTQTELWHFILAQLSNVDMFVREKSSITDIF